MMPERFNQATFEFLSSTTHLAEQNNNIRVLAIPAFAFPLHMIRLDKTSQEK